MASIVRPAGAPLAAAAWLFLACAGNADSAATATSRDDTPPPSCAVRGPGLTDCGPGGESCCASLPVPGGTFFRTYSNPGSGSTDGTNPATISGYRLDRYLVTVGRYRRFVAAWSGGTGYTPPVGGGKHAHLNGGRGLAVANTPGAFEPGWAEADAANVAPTDEHLECDPENASWTRTPGAREHLPVNCVNWWEAYAFCIWDGGFLPSEAEYRFAAAGGSEQRRYPWGSTPPGETSRYAVFGCRYPDGSGTCAGIRNLAPVGAAVLGAGRWGQRDLAGEMGEWNLDWHAPPVNPCVDCAALTPASGRVVRDGYFVSAEQLLLPDNRNGYYPTNRFANFGFRCARAP